MTSQKIAIDIVVLPSKKISEEAIRLSRKIAGNEIILGKDKTIPHISLAMGAVQEKDLTVLKSKLDILAQSKKILKLETDCLYSENFSGQLWDGITVKKSKELQKLHEEVMEILEPFQLKNVATEMFYPDPIPDSESAEGVENFAKNSGYEKFFPHITIGIGSLKLQATFAEEFEAKEIAICHLGRNCTCQNILASIPLLKDQ